MRPPTVLGIGSHLIAFYSSQRRRNQLRSLYTRKLPIMNATYNTKKTIVGGLLAGGVALAALGLGAGTAGAAPSLSPGVSSSGDGSVRVADPGARSSGDGSVRVTNPGAISGCDGSVRVATTANR